MFRILLRIDHDPVFVGEFCLVNLVLNFLDASPVRNYGVSGLSLGLFRFLSSPWRKSTSPGMKTLQVRLCGILRRKPLLKKHHHLGKIGFLVTFFAFSCPKNCCLNLEFQLGDTDRYMELARSPAVSFTRDSLGIYQREHVATGRGPSQFVPQ